MNNQLSQCTLTLNRECNLRCNFCYAKTTGYKVSNFLNFEEIQKIVLLCKAIGIKYIVLTGGEPTLYKDLFKVIKYIKTNKLIPTIATNGILISELEFCQNLIESGIDYIDISLKGFDKNSYIGTSGIDGYGKCLTAIQNLSKLNANFNCSMVLTEQNIDYFCTGVRDIFRNNGKSVSFTFEIDNEESSDYGLTYLRKKNPLVLINKFFNQIEKLEEISKGEWWIEYGFPLCMYREDQVGLLKNKMAKPCQVIEKSGITFDDKMNLIPCNMFYNIFLGQFYKDFSSVTEFSNFITCEDYKNKIDLLTSRYLNGCKNCKLYPQCGGGCPVYWKYFSLSDLLQYKKEFYEK